MREINHQSCAEVERKALFEAQTARLTPSKGRAASLKGEFGALQGDLARQESGGKAFEKRNCYNQKHIFCKNNSCRKNVFITNTAGCYAVNLLH